MSLLIFSTSVAVNQLEPLLSRDEADSWSHTQHLIWAEERWAGCRAADSKEATVPGSVAPLQFEREELWAKLLGLYEHSPYKLKSSVVCPKVSWVIGAFTASEREKKSACISPAHKRKCQQLVYPEQGLMLLRTAMGRSSPEVWPKLLPKNPSQPNFQWDFSIKK